MDSDERAELEEALEHLSNLLNIVSEHCESELDGFDANSVKDAREFLAG